MSNFLIRSAIFTALCFAVPFMAKAQNDSTKSVYNESVIVVGDYNPVLDGVTEKVNVAPAPNDNLSNEQPPKFEYSITPHRLSSVSATSGIKAAKVQGSPTRLYNNYLKFGLGHDFAAFADFNPLVDLYYTSTRHDNYAYGARLYHQTDVTTFGKADANSPSALYFGRTRESESRFDIFGKYILNKQHLFSANMAFDRYFGRYYGFSDSLLSVAGMTRDSIDKGDYGLAYNNLSLNLGAKSLNTDVNKFGYEANVALADMWGRYDFSQLSADIDASVHYGFPMFQKYKAIAYLRANWQGYRFNYDAPASLADLPLAYRPTAALPDSVAEGRHLLVVNPYVDFLFKEFKFHAGLAFGFNGYDDPDATTHNLFPDLSVSKSFSNNAISLTAGFKGGYLANDWNLIRTVNPFVLPAPQTFASVDNNLYANLRVSFSKKLMLSVSASNHFQKNMMSFRLDRNYLLMNVFKPYYVDKNQLNLSADFTFVNDEMITLTVGGLYTTDYNLPDNTFFLYGSDWNFHIDADVNYKDKWLFTLRTAILGKQEADYELNTITGLNEVTMVLPARFGMSLGAEYIHNRALSFFAKFDNLTCARYWLWANYPAPRFNALIGLTYTIPNI